MKRNIGKIYFLLFIIINNYCFSQENNNCNISRNEQNLIEKLDRDNYLDCTNKYEKKRDRLVKKISKMNEQTRLCLLESSSESIQYIFIYFYFEKKITPSNDVLYFFKDSIKNTTMFECKNSGTIKLFDYVVYRFRNNKKDNKELYNVFVENGGKLEDWEK